MHSVLFLEHLSAPAMLRIRSDDFSLLVYLRDVVVIITKYNVILPPNFCISSYPKDMCISTHLISLRKPEEGHTAAVHAPEYRVN